MDHTITHNVNDIPAEDKRALEGLLGAPLIADQQVFILAYTPGVIPSEEIRRQTGERLERTVQTNQLAAQFQGVTEVEAADAVAEAMQQIRRRF